MPGLKEQIRSGKFNAAAPSGFQLIKPSTKHFKDEVSLRNALTTQKDNTAYLDAESVMKRIGIDGRLDGTDYRLSNAAFGDLCGFCKIPSSYVRRVAETDEQFALEIIQHGLEGQFRLKQAKHLVLDTVSGRIDGIVGADTYYDLPNLALLDFALSAHNGLKMSNGWLCGPFMRITCISDDLKAEPKKGDIVRLGMDLCHAINGDGSARVSDYSERLVCTNGMVARQGNHSERISHAASDIELEVQKAILRATKRARQMIPLMDASAKIYLDDKKIDSIRGYIADKKNGGGAKLDLEVVAIAIREAENEGRTETEMSLWNFVNGVTEAAHQAKSLQRRMEIESMGHKVLERYALAHVSNN